jgi:molybdate transport system ATP-binding protein
LKLIRGELWPIPGKGERVYRLAHQPQVTAVNVREQISLVSPEMHDRYLQLDWKLTARAVVESGFRNGDYVYEKPTPSQQLIVAERMGLMGIQALAARNVQELSTGELRKVLIARALVGRPRVLALDEACDGLDTTARQDLLLRLQQLAQSGTQLLFSTHRRDEILPCICHILVMEKGRIAKAGPELSTIDFQRSTAGPTPSQKLSTSDHFTSRRPEVRAPAKARTLIRIEGADVYLERRRVLSNVNWEIRSNEHWTVLGRNGAGKSTLLKLAFGDLYPAWGGNVSRFEFTAKNTIWQVRQKIGAVSPELQANYRRPVPGRDVVGSGFFASIGLHKRLNRKQDARVRELMRAFDVSQLADKTALEMSYGELRKVLLLRAIVHRPAILICDEPFDGLDSTARGDFSCLLDRIAAQADTRLILVTHHVGDLPQSITHGLLLEDGEVVKQGRLEEVREHPLTRRFFEVV